MFKYLTVVPKHFKLHFL